MIGDVQNNAHAMWYFNYEQDVRKVEKQ